MIPIVIPTFNAVEHLQRCVATLEVRTKRPYQIYIADDCSPQTALHEFLDELIAKGRATVFKARTRKGYAEINNWAVAQVPKSEYLCLMNSDIEPLDGWLDAMAQELDDDPDVGLVGARLIYPETKQVGERFKIQHAGVARTVDGLPYHPFRGFPADCSEAATRRDVNAVTFACVLIRRSTWDSLQGLDESYAGGNFEDIDFCWKARDGGWKVIYQPKATLYHFEHGSGTEWITLHSVANRARLQARFANVGSDEHLFGLAPTMSDGSFVIGRPAQPAVAEKKTPCATVDHDFAISVVMPVYNRKENLYLSLCALDQANVQYDYPLEVIVTDDGSTDNPLACLRDFQRPFVTQYRWQPHKGYRASLAYNRGCAIARGGAFLLLGSDILLTPESLAHLSSIHKANPNAIIAGRYDWMLPMHIRPYDVYNHWDKIIAGTLPPAQFGGKPKGLIGVDPRYMDDPLLFDGTPRKQYAALLFADVLLLPRHIHEALGGFDENMVTHGGQDCELSIRAQLAGYSVIFTDLVHGYHVYHDRDQVANQRTLVENVRYIAAKHDLASVGLQIWGEDDNIYITASFKGGPERNG